MLDNHKCAERKSSQPYEPTLASVFSTYLGDQMNTSQRFSLESRAQRDRQLSLRCMRHSTRHTESRSVEI